MKQLYAIAQESTRRLPLSVLACASAIPNKRRLYIESPSLFSMLLKPLRSLS